jgi:hypothetical protein
VRPRAEYEAVKKLVASGLNDCAIARSTGIPRCTIRDWRRFGQAPIGYRGSIESNCPVCSNARFHQRAYSYLLGLYLGDGCISSYPRGVYRLRIKLDAKYPGIIAECAAAMKIVCGDRSVGLVRAKGWAEVGACWKHWPCVFPQHGPGKKHLRAIRLTEWQSRIALAEPGVLLRGFIHSDGCRSNNTVNGKAYPRYEFSNRSTDILRIFCNACDAFGVRWTQPTTIHISIARAPDVAKLDTVVGPKSAAGTLIVSS